MILDKKSVEKIFKHVNDKKAEEEKSLALFFDSDQRNKSSSFIKVIRPYDPNNFKGAEVIDIQFNKNPTLDTKVLQSLEESI